MKSNKLSGKPGKFRSFIDYARKHRIPVHPEIRKIGIAATLIGWAMIAFNETHQVPYINNFLFFFEQCIGFLGGTLLLFVSSFFCTNGSLKIRESTERKAEDQAQHIAHLSVSERKTLIFWRCLIAVLGYGFFSWSKSNSQIIDNSVAFSSDAIMYAGIMWLFLKLKISLRQMISLSVVLLGVGFMFSFNILGKQDWSNFVSLSIALFSAAALAVSILLNTVIIQHEPPIRVAFYQCLIGFAVALIFTVLWLIFDPSSLYLIDIGRIIRSLISGIIYAAALLFFFNAFLYTEPFLIVTLGYSILPFVAFFSWVSGHGIHSWDIIGGSLITIGGLSSIFFQYQEDKKNTHGNIAGYPVYLSTLKEKFRALKQDFIAGRLGKFEYLAQRHEFNKLIFEYANQLTDTEIEKIEICPGNVFFMIKPNGLRMLSDGGCRSAPLEILNLGSYEKEESSLVFQMVKDGDTIFDIGANVGWYSIQFAKRFERAIVHSFEPIPQTFEILEKNVRMNNLSNVFLHQLALGEKNGEADFYYFKGGSAIASRKNLLGHPKALKMSCEISSLDKMVKNLNLEKIDFIKCDVEGSELAVIRGGVDSISRFNPIIYMELFYGWCKQFRYTPDEVIEILKGFGYTVFKFCPRSLKKVKRIKGRVDNFNYVFLSEKKHKTLINKFANKKT